MIYCVCSDLYHTLDDNVINACLNTSPFVYSSDCPQCFDGDFSRDAQNRFYFGSVLVRFLKNSGFGSSLV